MRAGAKMLMISSRGGQNEMRNKMRSGGDMRNEMRGEMRNEMRGEGGSGGRNDMRGAQNEMRNEMRGDMRGNYGEMRDELESRFRDRRGREHYDNGRFAPRNDMEEMRGNYGEMRNEMRGDYGGMRGAQNEMRGDMIGEMRGAINEMRGAYGEMRGGQSHYPFGPIPPIYERGAEMNRIGFVVPIGRSEVGGNYPNDASYSAMWEMEHKTQSPMKGGASTENMMLTEDMAHEWMQNLHNEDGAKGPHWTKEQTKQVMNQKGIKMDPLEFWVVMNALYADYCSVLKKHGVNTIDFYVDMACAWLNDKDAQEGKTARYFQYITK